MGKTGGVRWNVWVDDWQLQCCGEPFRVGATVSWTLVPADRDWLANALGEKTAATIEWSEEHHSDPSPDQLSIEAEVTHISAAHARMEPLPGGDARHPVGGVLSPRTSADGWEKNDGELEFIGYVVTLAALDKSAGDPLGAAREPGR
ncbi:unnamed protein product [[Actinomadura] parvosata subsp. kistnae]|uniref:Uncharacterized protein n=1 Tax=[Actinomadura] parvosata subsp. kistnae TaxID=1909395 RepID=A0A1U9ZVR0_9ACTN|nr:DUF6578 domain-containing protein [Nonomuraea sp. ATCC 55076]AQZ62020.1 hypothetical protein BKM31_11530 [Nonomuraea sp. ATCC 55076]SPL99806.1 unnamed protein product [Actinomadura parvosata subsp. kistnae]